MFSVLFFFCFFCFLLFFFSLVSSGFKRKVRILFMFSQGLLLVASYSHLNFQTICNYLIYCFSFYSVLFVYSLLWRTDTCVVLKNGILSDSIFSIDYWLSRCYMLTKSWKSFFSLVLEKYWLWTEQEFEEVFYLSLVVLLVFDRFVFMWKLRFLLWKVGGEGGVLTGMSLLVLCFLLVDLIENEFYLYHLVHVFLF